MLAKAELKKLVQKYSGQGPRYTSYPTAVEFSPELTTAKWKNFLKNEFQENTNSNHHISLYTHIPFCKSLCYFCACHKIIPKDRSHVEPYLQALKREMSEYRNLLPVDAILTQIHWGGGSPSYLNESEIERLFLEIKNNFSIATENNPDISIELDPRTSSAEKIACCYELGFNRISFGVQDIDAKVQETINRIQPLSLTVEMLSAARKVGFKSVNIDLIYGLPEQTLDSFQATLAEVLKLRPERIALYGYAHVTWIKKVQKSFERSTLPTPEERIELFLMALERLTQAGYEHIGMDHFALKEDSLTKALTNGTLHRNFMGYSTHRGARQIALGASGISCFPRAFAQSHKDLKTYLEQVQENGFAIERGLFKTSEDMLRAEIIDQLFCSLKLDILEIERKFQINFWNKFSHLKHRLESFAQDGVLGFNENEISLTPTGRLFTRNIAMLFDEHLEKHVAKTSSVFSATV